jgi:F-type H+-transporting ATPase subunit b
MSVAQSLPLLAGDGWSPLSFDPGVLIWTWVVFTFVVFILAKTTWRPLLDALERRENKVAEGLKEAEEAREEARRIAEEFEAKVKAAHVEAQRIADESRASAERLSAELEGEAKERAEQLVDRAKDEINLARRQALEEIRERAVDLAISAAGAVLEKNVDEEDNRRLAANVIQMVSKEKTGS